MHTACLGIHHLASFSRIAGRTFTYVPKSIRIGIKHLAPIIEERKQKIAEYGMDYPDKPVSVHRTLDTIYPFDLISSTG